MKMPLLVLICFVLIGSISLSVLLTAKLIPFLKQKKLGQSILEIGPSWHSAKAGTPTMGGISFLLLVPIFVFLGTLLGETEHLLALSLVLFYAFLNGAIGVLDDASKLKNRQNQGLLPWQKLVLQALLAAAFLFVWQTHEGALLPLSLPFFDIPIDIGFAAYLLLMLVMVGSVNCANLTDGIDGLASSVSFVIGAFFVAEGLFLDNTAVLCLGLAMIGVLGGFLFFNIHPARIFMGDTGSLFLGALAVGGAFLLEKPLLVLLFGIVYVIEGVSVVLQVLIYKRTNKRLFLMAPLHHHLEKKGWSENRIVICFTLITALASLLAHLG